MRKSIIEFFGFCGEFVLLFESLFAVVILFVFITLVELDFWFETTLEFLFALLFIF